MLLAALCFATVLAIGVGGYITLCYRTLELSNRALHHGRSVELAETGMEEALWALNKNDWSSWTIAGSTARKTLTGFSHGNGTTGEASIVIDSFDGSAGPRTIMVTGKTVLPDGTVLERSLSSASDRAPLFLNAVAGTRGRVRFLSGGTVDSYDSTLGDYGAQTPGFSAILSSGSRSTTSATVQLTNAQVKGYVATLSTGPSYGTSAKLVGPSTPATTRIDANRISTSPYQPVFDEVVPSGTGTALPSVGAMLIIGNRHATTPEVYYASNINLSGHQNLTIDGPVILVVSGNLSIADSATIEMTTNASLRLHVGGDINLGGHGIQNQTRKPKNLAIVATGETGESFTMAVYEPFYGVIYTPDNPWTISYNQAIYGAIVARSATFNASPAIHYDISLRNTVIGGIDIPFAMSNWLETTNAD